MWMYGYNLMILNLYWDKLVQVIIEYAFCKQAAT